MTKLLLIMMTLFVLGGCNSSKSNQPVTASDLEVGGPCEGCEAAEESPVSFSALSNIDTLEDFNTKGPRMHVTGTIYRADGITPAQDVVLYIYHTDQRGIYPTRGNEKGWAKRHGYLRGWIKTNSSGKYDFYTLRPANYPNRIAPAHIHATIKEPGMKAYYIDEYLFNDDPLLSKAAGIADRGGSGYLTVDTMDNIMVTRRDIILGKNIPGYPASANDKKLVSGLAVGESCPAFDPKHITGPDKGDNACPMCRYGYGQGVMLWLNHPNLEKLTMLMLRLDKMMQQQGTSKLRVFVMMISDKAINETSVTNWTKEFDLKNVAITVVPEMGDASTTGVYKINPKAASTILVYKKRHVTNNYVNVSLDENFANTIKKELALSDYR